MSNFSKSTSFLLTFTVLTIFFSRWRDICFAKKFRDQIGSGDDKNLTIYGEKNIRKRKQKSHADYIYVGNEITFFYLFTNLYNVIIKWNEQF